MARPTVEPLTERLDMRVSREFLDKVEQWRKLQDRVPPRAEAIRTLALRSIEAELYATRNESAPEAW